MFAAGKKSVRQPRTDQVNGACEEKETTFFYISRVNAEFACQEKGEKKEKKVNQQRADMKVRVSQGRTTWDKCKEEDENDVNFIHLTGN